MDLLEQDLSIHASSSYTGERLCGTCKAIKHVTEFPMQRSGRSEDGFRSGKCKGDRSSRCKACNNERNRLYREKNLDKIRSVNTAYKTVALHYGVDEKFGDTWQALDAALSMCRMTTPLRRAA